MEAQFLAHTRMEDALKEGAFLCSDHQKIWLVFITVLLNILWDALASGSDLVDIK